MKSSAWFLIVIFLTVATCAVLQKVWNVCAPPKFVASNGFVLLAFFALSAVVVHFFLLSSAKGNAQAFVRKFMVSTVFKLLLYIFFLVVLLLFTRDSKPALILHFLFYYAVFTVLEVVLLYLELGKKKQ